MPIEFRCTKCGKLLRTPDETAGKQARCPECGTVGMIPAPTVDTIGAAPAMAASDVSLRSPAEAAYAPLDAANLYQVPTTGGELPRIAAGKVTFGDVYGRAWAIFRRRWLLCVVVVATAFALKLLIAYGMLPARMRLVRAGVPPNAVLAVSGIISDSRGRWLKAGQIYFFLNVAAGKPAKITDLLAGGRWFLTLPWRWSLMQGRHRLHVVGRAGRDRLADVVAVQLFDCRSQSGTAGSIASFARDRARQQG